ncbi:hypothetical protein HCJ66_01035 [Listeria sp. FSL L7-1582]|uniref:hypothetical protein n=1 Tax=Listeria portnoyi TaxID=2713504 RepID=UPI00164E83FD|nr:hypothetical protein [Listeria portnoyi]MBC6308126.1 hypothetical protein [Listeria portnoyi]
MYDKIVEEYDRIANLNNIISSVPQQKKAYNRLVGTWAVISFVSMQVVNFCLGTSLISYLIVFMIFVYMLFVHNQGRKKRKIIYKSKGCTTYEQYKFAVLNELLEKYNLHGDKDINEIISVSEKIISTNSKNLSWIYVLIAALALPSWNSFVQDQLLKNNYFGIAIITPIVIVICCFLRALFELFPQMISTERSRQKFFYNQLIKYKYEVLVRQKQEQL